MLEIKICVYPSPPPLLIIFFNLIKDEINRKNAFNEKR